MNKETEERYLEIVEDLKKDKALKQKVSTYLEEREEIEFISVTEAARRYGFTYITMRKTCRDNINNKEYPFVRRIGSRLVVRPDILDRFLKGE